MCSAEAAKRRAGLAAAALLASVCFAQPARAQSAASGETDPAAIEARERVGRGERLFARGDFAAAITEYERAYELVPGHAVQHHALFNIAKCYEKLFQYGKALDYYARYLREGGPGALRRDEVQRTIAHLQDHLATLRVVTNVPAEIWVDGRLAGEAPGAVLLGGGRHAVTLRATGYEPVVFEVALAVRQEHQRQVSLQPLSAVEGAPPAWFWASATAAGAALAAGAVLGAIALSKSSALDARLSDPVEALTVTPADADEAADFALAADVALGSAMLLSATSVVLYFVTDWDGRGRPESRPRGERARPRAVATVGPDALGLAIEGAW
jgi:hypothetical protein